MLPNATTPVSIRSSAQEIARPSNPTLPAVAGPETRRCQVNCNRRGSLRRHRDCKSPLYSPRTLTRPATNSAAWGHRRAISLQTGDDSRGAPHSNAAPGPGRDFSTASVRGIGSWSGIDDTLELGDSTQPSVSR